MHLTPQHVDAQRRVGELGVTDHYVRLKCDLAAMAPTIDLDGEISVLPQARALVNASHRTLQNNSSRQMHESIYPCDRLQRGSILAGILVTVLAPSFLANAQLTMPRAGVAQIARPSGQGAFDATKLFEDALNRIGGGGGGTIEFTTPGTYYISSSIELDQSRAVHVECSTGASRTAADSQVINIVYSGDRGSLFAVRGAVSLEIDHCNLGYSNPAYRGDLIELFGKRGIADATEVYIHDSRIGGLSTSGSLANSLVRIEFADHIVIERNMFMNASTAILGPSDSIIAANLISIRSNYFSGRFGDVAIRAGGDAWTVAENVFEPKAPDICGAFDTTAVGVIALSFRGNWIGDGHHGTCIAASRGPILGGEISGNQIEGGTVGIALGKSNGVSITGNHLQILQTGIDASAASEVNIAANSYSSIAARDKVHLPVQH